MSAEVRAAPADQARPALWDRGGVLSVSSLHFAHDVYGSMIGTLLPVLIERLGIPFGVAGGLATAFRLPSVLQPFLGYWADRYDARMMVVWAPTATAIAVTSLGWAPSYFAMVVCLIIGGVSSAAFHPAAGAAVTRVAGDRWGRASAYFAAGGEIGRALGPALIGSFLVYAAIEQMWVLALIALSVSLLAYGRVAGANARIPRPPPPAALRAAISAARGPLLLMTVIVLLRSLSWAGVQTYLPTYMTRGGTPLQVAGLALTVFEIGGVIGVFAGGAISDRLGRRTIMLASQITSGPTLITAILLAGTPLGFAALALGGFLSMSAGGVQVALMQELLPGNRSVATGITYFLSFESSVVATLALGFAADIFGLGPSIVGGLLLSMLSLPFTMLLPETRAKAT